MQAYRLVRRPGDAGAGVTHDAGAGQGVGRSDGPAVSEPRSGGSAVDATHPRRTAARHPDPVQAEAVAHTDGPMLVVGGPRHREDRHPGRGGRRPGAEGVDPERVLVLTFGRRGATELRRRIEARIAGDGHRAVREPLVRTFPAYAFGLLRRAAAERGEPSPRLLTGPEQDLIIRELLDVVGEEPADDPVGWPEDLRPALRTRAFAQQLRDLLMRAAERGVGRSSWPGWARSWAAPTGRPPPASSGNTSPSSRCAT